MMKSKKFLAGVGAGLILTLAAVMTAALGWWPVAIGLLGILLTANLALSLDTNRRVQYLRPWMRRNFPADRGTTSARATRQIPARGGATQPGAAPATSEDFTGAVRLMQAQFVGRLDRAEAALEAAAKDMREARERHDVR